MFDHEVIHGGRFRELLAETAQPDELDRALRFAYLAWYSYGANSAGEDEGLSFQAAFCWLGL
jgi:hypothetical protein